MTKEKFIREFSEKYNYKIIDVEYYIDMILSKIRESESGLPKEKLYDNTRMFNTQSRFEFTAYLINHCKVSIKKRRIEGSRKPSTVYRYKN